MIHGRKASTHPVRNTKEAHLESYSPQGEESGQRVDSKKEDLKPPESLLSQYSSPSTSFGSQSGASGSSSRLSGALNQQAAAQSTSHGPGIFTAHVAQSWILSRGSSTNQYEDRKSLIEGKVDVDKESRLRDDQGADKGEQLHRERDEYPQIGNIKPSVGGQSAMSGLSSPPPCETSGPSGNVPRQWEVAEAIPSEGGISLPPFPGSPLQENYSPEIAELERNLHGSDPTAMGGNWVAYEETNRGRQFDVEGSKDRRETQQNSGHFTDHGKGNLDSLNSLLRLLSLQGEAECVDVILRVYDEFRECAVCDGGEQGVEDSSTQPRRESSQSQSRSSNKRLQQELEDSDSEKRGLKKRKRTEAQTIDVKPGEFLACPFYKLNPYIYSACSHFKGLDISKTGHHLRTFHTGENSCAGCYKSFRDAQERDIHDARDLCRSTRGPSVLNIKISKKQGITGKERWFDIRSQLFPDMQRPENPWWSHWPTELQIILTTIKKIREQGGTLPSSKATLGWSHHFRSEWSTSPPEHLPDLLKQWSPRVDDDVSTRSAQTNSAENIRPPAVDNPQGIDIGPGIESSMSSFIPLSEPSDRTDNSGPSSQINTTSTQRETTPSSTPSSNFGDDIKSPLPDSPGFDFSGNDTLEMLLTMENNTSESGQIDQGAFIAEGEMNNWEGPALFLDADFGVPVLDAQHPEASIWDNADPNYIDLNYIDPNYINLSYIDPSAASLICADPTMGLGLLIGEEPFDGAFPINE
ncbi:hypothetical protein O1611_g15 [Lasiodiplodia mahajangana]|uniref:Uncharacterized protein n=1 Tax=Lasiodiplodia mahajangana TaxID=1108764 RepID=A0ACC2K1P2_9PEZI|nr:hypothetical protein O1611_g15 [Lasiodiplodia mahajangana]